MCDTILTLANGVTIPLFEIEIQAVRSQGSGGQNVNKVSTAIHLRFDIKASSLPEPYKERLLHFKDHRISSDGIVVIKAQRFRSQAKNKTDALSRLQKLINDVLAEVKSRKATRPTLASKTKRLEEKSLHSRKKILRGKIVAE